MVGTPEAMTVMNDSSCFGIDELYQVTENR